MSVYNDICRRPHLPREMPIRKLMAATGIDLKLYGPCSSEDLEGDLEEVLGDDNPEATPEESEEGEEEPLEDDPCSFD